MLADRMASVGTLAAGVAHEINNPLAAVIANLDMALAGRRRRSQRAALPATSPRSSRTRASPPIACARSCATSRSSRARRKSAAARSTSQQVLDSTLRMAWNEIRHRAKLVKHYGNVPRVDANESRLGQVFLNLIVNAAQAIPEGNVDRERDPHRDRARGRPRRRHRSPTPARA